MSKDNKAVVRRFARECWDEGNFDVADELVAEPVVRNGQPVGRRGLVGVIAAIRAAFPDFHTEVEDLVAEDDRVAWRYSSGGKHTGAPLFGTAATGRTVNWTGTAIVRIAAGRIQDIWDNVDLFAIYTQLGVVTPPGSVGPDS
jgi:predicted ester cyclase